MVLLVAVFASKWLESLTTSSAWFDALNNIVKPTCRTSYWYFNSGKTSTITRLQIMAMNTENPSASALPSSQSGRHVSPSPHDLRRRPLARAATLADGYAQMNRRRSSFLSETLSETRKSFRSSTDDILLPRARGKTIFKTKMMPLIGTRYPWHWPCSRPSEVYSSRMAVHSSQMSLCWPWQQSS